MRATKVHVASRHGDNKAPGSGDVWFDDGKSYGFSFLPEAHGGGVRFFLWRQRYGMMSEQVSFTSQRRAKALLAALEG